MTSRPSSSESATLRPRRIVDSHTHLLPDRLAIAIREFFGEHLGGEIPYPCDREGACGALREAGVHSCWALPYVRRAGSASALNQWMASAFKDDPFVEAGATVHPGDDVQALLHEALDVLELAVVKIHCSVGSFQADDPRLDALWSKVSESGHPVVVHAGHAVAGTTASEEIAPLARVAARWPSARLIVAHTGAPAVEETLALMRRAPSVYADLAPVVRDPVGLDTKAIDGLEHRILFGSDAPNVVFPIDEGIRRVRSWQLSDEHEAAILGGNAERLLSRA